MKCVCHPAEGRLKLRVIRRFRSSWTRKNVEKKTNKNRAWIFSKTQRCKSFLEYNICPTDEKGTHNPYKHFHDSFVLLHVSHSCTKCTKPRWNNIQAISKNLPFLFSASSLVASDVITTNYLKWRIINTSKFLSLWLLVVQLKNYLLRNFHSDRVFAKFFGTACLNFRVAVLLGLLIMIGDYVFHGL